MRRLLGIYLILLLLSTLWQLFSPPHHPQQADQDSIHYPSPSQQDPIHLAYRQLGDPNQPTVLLIHGSPMASRSLDPLIPELQKHFHLILPDLPGFAGSRQTLNDYSFALHAESLAALIDQQQLHNVHLVGYSMGGGVALNLSQLRPHKIKSLTLLSAIGVQEHELLGNYHLNHFLHSLQLAALHLVDWFTPHFGSFDHALIGISYARNFYDSDQRPLEAILRRLTLPTLILHTTEDRLVPLRTAEEHHRLVPHSHLHTQPGSHIAFMNHPDWFTQHLTTFIQNPSLAPTTSQQMAQAQLPITHQPFAQLSLLATLAIILALVIGTYITEDLTCILSGILVAQAGLPFPLALIGCLLGIFTGDMLLFYAGRRLGLPALRRAPLRWFLKPQMVDRATHWIDRRGALLILTSRFLPGARLPTYFAMGMARVPIGRFLFFFLLSALLWTPILISLASWFGESLFAWFDTFSHASLWILASLILGYLAFKKILLPSLTWKGRRHLSIRIRRIRHWEFWPAFAFYPPVILYILYLGLRHRSLTLFTACNPAMPASGFVEESKTDILAQLKADNPQHAIGRWLTLTIDDATTAQATIDHWMKKEQLRLPIVAKPDTGQRGQGVTLLHTTAQLQQHLSQARGPWIMQEYIGGQEYGVFYHRHPQASSGHIFSITSKHLLHITGDGQHSVEELILQHPRAQLMAPYFSQAFAQQWEDILPTGQTLDIAPIGTHARGALFTDGSHLITPALTQWIDQQSQYYNGFYFGRYDLKAPDDQHLQNAQNIRIIELNGVTSESTNIYDPQHSLLFAYQTLFAQWKLAFRIGQANQQQGAKVTSIKELATLIKQYRDKQ